MESDVRLCPNRLVEYLKKSPEQFRKSDIVRFVKENGIRMINFMYPADDNRLKTLNFVINSEDYLDTILTYGERVDGSSLFPFIEAGNSDLYVMPRFSTAFVDPFSEIPTLTMLATFFDKEGKPMESSPEYTLKRACQAFTEETGMEFYAMGELEYYVIAPDPELFPASDQKGYHESTPFSKFSDFRTECMSLIAQAGGQIKYGHSEVGNFTLDGLIYEQNEIEFLPIEATRAADNLMIAKWIIRTLAAKRGYDVTFAPKLTVGKAGSGLHIHFQVVKDGVEQMTDRSGEEVKLSDTARRAIAGILEYAPLGWTCQNDMCSQANPLEAGSAATKMPQKQTAELRSGDGSADIYQLIAGMVVAARKGFENPDALRRAQEMYVDFNIHDSRHRGQLENLRSLPDSCAASAKALAANREAFEEKGVFSPRMIDGIISKLEGYHDEDLRQKTEGDHNAMMKLVHKYWHCG